MHKLNRVKLLLGAPVLALLATCVQTAQAGVLDKVKAHGSVRCGVAGDKPGFSLIDDKGRWTGMDVDLCRAVAAAVLGDADKVEYLTTTAKNNLVAPGAMRNVKLTDEQKADMKKLFEQRLATRKEALANAVKSGQITQAQADNQIQRMQDHFNYRLENGMGPNNGGRGMGGGKGPGRGGFGGGAGGCNRF